MIGIGFADTWASKSDCRSSRRFGVKDDEIEGEIWSQRSEEMSERPLQCVDAVLAVVDSDHHDRFLRRRHFFVVEVSRTQAREQEYRT